MKNETKPLKACSIKEIENAIAKAICNLTNTDVNANVSIFKLTDSNSFTGQDQFELFITLKVGVSYTHGLDKNDDGSYKL